ncbi:MAG: metallophosphoesterase [Ignavibacteriaceae bacterium]
MKINLLKFSFVLITLLSLFVSCVEQKHDEEFSFIVTCDMRRFAMEQYRSPEWTLGGFHAIKEVGKGDFMISPGDVEPPDAVRDLIDIVLGKDYPWYPGVGNHDLEDNSYMEYLRDLNRDGKSLPNIVNRGPSGCEETTYSFDWKNAHFVNLNLYYDGIVDNGADGNVVPELLAWLEKDLAQNNKKHIFVFGHDPIISMPDMDSGIRRHVGNSLDKYPDNSFQFQQLLLKYNVTAYVCGHTHTASFSSINGLWQLDAGHIRGMEGDFTPEKLFNRIKSELETGTASGSAVDEIIKRFYASNKKEIDKTLFAMELVDVNSYKEIKDDQGLEELIGFYKKYQKGNNYAVNSEELFWNNCPWSKSSFLKIFVGPEDVRLEIYRDDGRGGKYSFSHNMYLYRSINY